MYEIIAEQPLLVSGLLACLAVAFLFGWMQTGNKIVMAAGLIFSLLIPCAFIAAANLVTEREQISAAIYRTADAVANNDFESAVAIIDPSQRDKVTAAKADLSRFRFDEARVNRLRTIDIVEGSIPLAAEVDMSVTVVVSDQRGQIQGMRVPRRVILKFRKAPNDQWHVYDYNHLPIVGDPDGFSPQR